jgi:hypothetical protein
MPEEGTEADDAPAPNPNVPARDMNIDEKIEWIVLGRMGTRGRYVCRLHVRREWGGRITDSRGGRLKADGVAVLELDSIGASSAAWNLC